MYLGKSASPISHLRATVAFDCGERKEAFNDTSLIVQWGGAQPRGDPYFMSPFNLTAQKPLGKNVYIYIYMRQDIFFFHIKCFSWISLLPIPFLTLVPYRNVQCLENKKERWRKKRSFFKLKEKNLKLVTALLERTKVIFWRSHFKANDLICIKWHL